ncbi:MAG: hypothetical protein BM485_13680 [Desulfobulbaceae bacterium DB1]|nr:MAG: hypothetical protein BM485_13680 [Desulfobulbaceae bacterium DB1]
MAATPDNAQNFIRMIGSHREGILLALAGALLHNLGKVSSHFIEDILSGKPKTFLFQHIIGLVSCDLAATPSTMEELWEEKHRNVMPTSVILTDETIEALAGNCFALPFPFDDRLYRPGDLIEYLGQGKPESQLYAIPTGGPYGIEKIFSKGSRLTHLMNRAHRAASGGEKEGILKDPQKDPKNLWQATPFGWERRIKDCSDPNGTPQIDELKLEVEGIIQKYLLNRATPFPFTLFAGELQKPLSQAIADTNRPINDVSVWDIGHAGTAFLLAFANGLIYRNQAISHRFFDNDASPNSLTWRILRVSVDGLTYLSQAAKMADIRVRQKLLHESLEGVRRNLEDIPLAMEVYRDENGSAFVFPDVPKDSGLYMTTREIIDAAFEKVDVKPEIILSGHFTSWPIRGENERKQIDRAIKSFHHGDPALEVNIKEMEEAWANQQHAPRQICTACGLRPQGYGAHKVDGYRHNPDYYRDKAASRHICCICMDRRRGIAEEWATEKLGEFTVWTDEVADRNERLALITGSFDLHHFLDNHFYPSQVENRKNCADSFQKGARSQSFARLRRVWEVTRQFWREITDSIEKVTLRKGPRLQIMGKLEAGKEDTNQMPGKFHAYELLLKGVIKMNVVWDPIHNNGQGRFISADNLEYLANQLKESSIEEFLRNKTIPIYEPSGYGGKDKEWGLITIRATEQVADSEYIPAIPILREPQHFMALVPGDKGWEIARRIKEKYEREMGKVLNRLPIHLGIVFAQHRTPLRAILNAGVRMLTQKRSMPDRWVVEELKHITDDLPDEKQFLRCDNDHFAEVCVVALRNENHGKTIMWHVPACMGDGETKDAWYPHVKLAASEETDSGRPGDWKVTRQDKDTEKDNVVTMRHVESLQAGDKIFFAPSTLDWVWLDTAARRFEIGYGEDGCRLNPEQRHRPYLLDEMEKIDSIRRTLFSCLTTNQIYGLHSIIEAKLSTWEKSDAGLRNELEQFFRDCLAKLDWKDKNKNPCKHWGADPDKDAWLAQWAHFAASGLLTDTIELYMQVQKERPETEKKEQDDE